MNITFKDGTNDAHFHFVAHNSCLSDISFTGTVKFDGCTHLYNGDPDDKSVVEHDTDYMHLCDQFDEVIALMVALKAEGARRFAARFPETWRAKS